MADDQQKNTTTETGVTDVATQEPEEVTTTTTTAAEAVATAPGADTPDVAAPEAENSADADQSGGEPSPSVAESENNITDVPAMSTLSVGFFGEITGDVIKLEDLESGTSQSEEARYEALRKMVDETMTNVTAQEIVTGRVVSVGEKDVVIDIGFKSDGIVSKSEFETELEAGQEVEVFLERIEDYQGQLVLSKTKADKVKRWQRIEHGFENEEVLEGTIVRRIKGGMIVELFDGVEAFLPGSQIDVRPVRDFDAYLEKRMEFKIVKLNPANENIVVSHKALIEKDLEAQRRKILSTMEPGQILEGTVKNIVDFGVFIDLGGVDGLLHITDLSWGRVSHPSELVDLDQKLNVVVLDYDKERSRISLGLKQLQPHPWENIGERYAETSVVEGKVVSITDYGAFVELEKGIEGLVHISEMSWTEHIKHPSQAVSLGQMVQVKILNIDDEGKKISLGMKQLMDNPWATISDRYPPGAVLRGKVRNITNFGVFVEIEPGIDGLVHISDLSWTRKIKHPSEIVKKGQELDVVVLGVDSDERRISLGHKQVETNPWNQFGEVYAEGSKTEGTVTRVEEKGVVVTLPLEVEAFIPASELRHGGGSLAAAYPEGTKLEDLTVVSFDAAQKDIILSQTAEERAVVREEKESQYRETKQRRDNEARAVRDYKKTTAATAGPTTLGEISGLGDLKARMEEAESEAASPEDDAAVDTEDVETPAVRAADAPASEDDAAVDSTDEAAKKS